MPFRLSLSASLIVLLIDLPGQGASTASFVTFGLREATGVRAAHVDLHA